MLVSMQDKNPFHWLLTIQVKEAFCKVEENACIFLRVDIFYSRRFLPSDF